VEEKTITGRNEGRKGGCKDEGTKDYYRKEGGNAMAVGDTAGIKGKERKGKEKNANGKRKPRNERERGNKE
jgi:hypothetical protein